MTVVPEGDSITLIHQSTDELHLLACIVEAIRAGGTIEATAGIGRMKLEFDGDPAEAKPKKRKRHQRKAGSP